MTFFQAQKVHGGAVVRTNIVLRRARKALVPAGTQGVVQGVVYLPARDRVRFTVKWNVRGEEICLPIFAKNATLIRKGEEECI